jgi:hypothetical protein
MKNSNLIQDLVNKAQTSVKQTPQPAPVIVRVWDDIDRESEREGRAVMRSFRSSCQVKGHKTMKNNAHGQRIENLTGSKTLVKSR